MPRRRRIAKTRLPGAGQLTRAQRAFFLNPFGQFSVGTPCLYAYEPVFADREEARAAWDLHRDNVIAEHDARQPQDELWPRREFDALPTHEDDILVEEP